MPLSSSQTSRSSISLRVRAKVLGNNLILSELISTYFSPSCSLAPAQRPQQFFKHTVVSKYTQRLLLLLLPLPGMLFCIPCLRWVFKQMLPSQWSLLWPPFENCKHSSPSNLCPPSLLCFILLRWPSSNTPCIFIMYVFVVCSHQK